ncbi:MAG: carboxypeptidase regulatory-like domain-containing protein [Candidatus Cryptobacteroides sp.]
MKKILSLMLSMLVCVAALAQSPTGGIKGKIVSRSGRVPIAEARLTLTDAEGTAARLTSDQNGDFVIEDLENGSYTILVEADGFVASRVNVAVEGFMRNLMFVTMQPEQVLTEVDESSFADLDMDDSGYQNIPTVLSSSSDVFDNTAGYKFSAIRFRQRGFDSNSQDVYLAGIRLNDAVTGYTPWSLWSGLNEATRDKETTSGVGSLDYGVGGYNGITNITGTASSMRKGWRFSVLSNSAMYRLRLMGSYATGEMDNGWSFAANVSIRAGGNDWIDGVYYRSIAYWAGAEKNWNDIHRLSFSVFGSPVQRGAQNSSTQEVYDLVGSNYYNSNWGWQDGKIRNSRVRNNHEPVAVLKYTWTPKFNFSLDATAIYRTGRNGYSALDWYDAADPRPDYYRNLPSYFYNEDENYAKRDSPFQAGWAEEAWIYNYNDVRHVNWDRMYNVNRNNVDTRFDPERNRSKYVQEERRQDQNDLNFGLTAKYLFPKYFTLKGGATFRWNRTEYYKIIKDLLGGDYYVNIDQFAERDFASSDIAIQNDLQYYYQYGHPQLVEKGDKYGYDYYANVRNATLWANLGFEAGQWKAWVAAQGGYDSFWRFGNVQKGLFPDTSYGKSAVSSFFTYRVKGGVSWNSGPHRIWANAGYFTEAPLFTESFISPRTRNTLASNLQVQKTVSADLSYAFNKNNYSLRVTGYYTNIADQTDLMSFYDDSQNSFTNFAMSGIDERHCGIELGFQIPLPLTGLSLQGALNWGEYVYTSTPRVVQTIDNSDEIVMDDIVPYWSYHSSYKRDSEGNVILDKFGDPVFDKKVKHYVPSTPQIAANLGLNYANNYLFAGIDLQYFDKMYLDMNPLYRTDLAVLGPDGQWSAEEEEYMASQERFKHAFILNANIGKSWYIQRKYNIGFSLEVKNILNTKSVKTGGYEQTRLIDSEDLSRYYRFDSKYFYMVGVNYMLNLYFRF